MISSLLHHSLVKDLAWLVEGHYIECDFDLQPYWVADVNERLLLLDREPGSLVTAVNACKSHFLGSYFETLFSFAIEHLSHLKIHLEHFQIESEEKTLGEVDMLVETPDGKLHQFEIAIKFYLERPDLFPHDWIGPNKSDSLLKKVTRAREHQLQILQTEEGLSAINDVAKGRQPISNLLVFGRLYSALNNAEDIRDWLRGTECGAWIRISNMHLLTPWFEGFLILQKPHWLSVPNISDNFSFNSLQSAYNLVGDFLLDDRPRHMLLKSILYEIDQMHRFVFVVPDSW